MRIDELKFLKIEIKKHPTRDIKLEYLKKENAVASLILDFDESKVLLVEQYRPTINKKILEIPAGMIEKNEEVIGGLAREIREETGYEMNSFQMLYIPNKPLILSPGYTSEELYVFIMKLKTKDEKNYEKQLDEGEDLECYWYDVECVKEKTNDFKTHYALELYKNMEKIKKKI